MPAVASEGAADPKRIRRAVLIGISKYDAPELPGLQAPPKDVAALAQVLRDPECAFDEVVELVDPEFQDMREQLEQAFISTRDGNLLLIYFSGHGKLSEIGD